MNRIPINVKQYVLTLLLVGYFFMLLQLIVLAQDNTVQQSVGRIQHGVLKSVVKVVSSPDNSGQRTTGTGFLVSRQVGGKRQFVFLVTNKHTVGDWNMSDGSILNFRKSLDVYFYQIVDPSGAKYKPFTISITDNTGKPISKRLVLHSDPKIDVAAIALDQELLSTNNIDLVSFDTSFLLPFNKIISEETSGTGLGDQVFALGYPLGITSLNTNYPIAKGGYIASVPGQEFRIDVPTLNRQGQQVKATIQGKIVIVDGLIVPGNSGGPVIIPAETKVRVNPESKQFQYSSMPTQNLVIGIVSTGLGTSGLTAVVSSDYILDLINTYQ